MIQDESKCPTTLTSLQRSEMKKSAYNTLYLYLANNILWEVDDLEDPFEIWKMLDDLYLTKTLPNKIYLLKRIFAFKMDSSKVLQDNINIFNKLILDLTNCKIKFLNE